MALSEELGDDRVKMDELFDVVRLLALACVLHAGTILQLVDAIVSVHLVD